MLKGYRLATVLATPILWAYLRVRLARGKEDAARFKERFGFASSERPNERLVWCHAASVGEAMSVLSLLRAFSERHKDWSLLLTTGTVSSARMIAQRLPANARHQYVPVDSALCVARFLDHWRPDAVLWMESELWPCALCAVKDRRIPAALINGRMSERSFKRWRFFPAFIKNVLSAFSLGLAQTEKERARFAALGLENTRVIGNLKHAATPLSCSLEELERLRLCLGARPVWLMASTHEGEEELALDVHARLARKRQGLLTIIVPRHPTRSKEIAALVAARNLSCAQRSAGETLTPETEIYLADTMGELGLFYRLVRHVCLAGSFAWGGHNPIEPAQLGCTVIFGPRMDNFAAMAEAMLACGAARQVRNGASLAACLETLMNEPQETQELVSAALKWSRARKDIIDETLAALAPLLEDGREKKETP